MNHIFRFLLLACTMVACSLQSSDITTNQTAIDGYLSSYATITSESAGSQIADTNTLIANATTLLTNVTTAMETASGTTFDTLTMQQNVLTGLITLANQALAILNLNTLFGNDRTTTATALYSALAGDITTITNYQDAYVSGNDLTSGDVSTAYTILINACTALQSYCSDHEVLGTLQNSVATPLYAMATIDISQSASTISSTIATQNTALDGCITSYTSATIANTSLQTVLAADSARAQAAQNIADALVTFASYYGPGPGTLAALLASVPSPDDDSIEDFDTSFAIAEEAIQPVATTTLNYLSSAATLIAGLVATDESTRANQIDYIADAAVALQAQITQFTSYITALYNKATLGISEVALRVLQAQLLFNSNTYAQQQTLINSIISGIASNSLAATQLQGTIGFVGSLLTVTPPTFESAPLTPAPSNQPNVMQQQINAQVATYLNQLQGTILALFTSPPSQDTINNALANLSPAVFLQMTSNVMASWLTARQTYIAGYEDLSDLPSGYLSDYATEWMDLQGSLLAVLNDGIISTAAIGFINNAIDANYTELFSNLTVPNDFTVKVNALLKRPAGMVSVIMTQGINEFQRLATDVIIAIQNGSLTAPVVTTSNAPINTPSTLSVPENPTTTIDSSTTNSSNIMTQTLGDGDTVYLTGTGTLATYLRDPVFSSEVTDKLSASVQIFMNNSARIGLGTASISTAPGNTLNVLGGSDTSESSSVQIVPDGNCFITVNSDLLIGGSQPLVATPNFGLNNVHQITFYSEVPRTITVTTNTTWDLSSFGLTGIDPATQLSYTPYGKQIVFGGMVSLVLEPGAKIRFPYVDPTQLDQSVVLYFNDQSQLIFQGDPLVVGNPWTGSGIAGTDCKRNKILGMGQIWFDKSATMVLNKPALVGIEADYTTPLTDITLSLFANAQVLIGTTGGVPGGALQIGNMYDGGSSADPENADTDPNFPNSTVNANPDFVPNTTAINFTLYVDGQQPLFQIGQQGFLGFAAGVINKDGAPASAKAGPNGSAGIPNTAWQLQRLYNVANITLNVTQGIFDHSIIADGTMGSCSMFAIGKPENAFPYSKYLLLVGLNELGIIRGGGNIYFVDKDASMVLVNDGVTIEVAASPITVNLTNIALPLSFSLSNSGTYAPLAPSYSIKNQYYNIPGITSYSLYGRAVVQSTSAVPYAFAGPVEEFYSVLTLSNYSDTTQRYVPMSITNSIPLICYVNNGSIVRSTLQTNRLLNGVASQASGLGYLRGSKQIGGGPTAFYLPIE